MLESLRFRFTAGPGAGFLTRGFSFGLIGFCLLYGSISSKANQVATAPGFGPFQQTDGGEFTLIPDAGVAALMGNYSPFTMNYVQRGSFQTFCVEYAENIAPNTTYDVTTNSVTMFTGIPLSAGAAYLYAQFATGQLNYNYDNSPNDSRRYLGTYNAQTLQNAIWYLMGETTGQANNPYVLQANSALVNPFAPDNGAHDVMVLNLWAPNQPHDAQHAYQDQLIYTGTVPEPSVFALISVAGLLAFRRRK